MKKIDFKKEFKDLYNPSSKEASLADIPEWNCLMLDGSGNPNNSEIFQNAVQALYNVAFTIKFALKKARQGPEYSVPPFEGLWWMADNRPFNMLDKNNWLWTLMIPQPSHVTNTHFMEAIEAVIRKKTNPLISRIRMEAFKEGLSAQILHIGPYSTEGPTIEKLHNFIERQGHKLSGKHHEIYLSDPRKTAPEKLKTILRQPVLPKGG